MRAARIQVAVSTEFSEEVSYVPKCYIDCFTDHSAIKLEIINQNSQAKLKPYHLKTKMSKFTVLTIYRVKEKIRDDKLFLMKNKENTK